MAETQNRDARAINYQELKVRGSAVKQNSFILGSSFLPFQSAYH